MKRTTVLFFLLVSAVAAQAQSYSVVSDLFDDGSAAVLSYVGNVTSYHSTVLLGHFSKVGQATDDIGALDANGNFSCSQNNNDGTFSAPVVTPATPSGSTPTAVKLFSATDATTATDSVWIAAASTAGSSLIRLTNFANCVPSVSGGSLPNVAPSVTNFFSDVFTFSVGGTPENVVLATSSDSQVWMLSSAGGTYGNVDDNFFMGGTYAVPGPFNEVACSSCPNYLWAIVTVEPQSSNAPAPFAMVSTDATSTLGRGNFVDLEGQNFLAFIFTPDKNIVAISATGNQVFFDAVSLSTGQPSILNVGAFTLSANPVDLVRGNFANNTEHSDVAVANGNQIAILTYVGVAGAPAWNLAQTLQASGTIQAVATGSLSSTGNEIVAQIGSNAEVFSTVSFTELPPPPPPTPTYSLTVQVSGNGTVALNPSGATFPSGTVITLTATPQTGATFSSWSNACQGTQNVCTVTLTSNLSVLATFTTNPTPSLAVAPPSAIISAGNSASYAVTPNNFSSAPTLTASCSIPKGSCGISNGQLVITTTASTTIGVLTFDFQPLLPLLVTLLLYVLLIPKRIPKRTPKFAFGFLVVLLLTGCSGGSHVQPAQQIIQGTPSGSYTITVAGTSGSQSATTQATLVVQ